MDLERLRPRSFSLGSSGMEDGPDSSCKRPCRHHPISDKYPNGIVAAHIPELEDFVNELSSSLSELAFPRREEPYASAHVLFLNWQQDDLNTIAEVDDLESVFKTIYHFTTERYQIPSEDPFNDLEESLVLTRNKHARTPNNLLIIYYGGHGELDKENRSIWKAWKFPPRGTGGWSPQLDWTELQLRMQTAKGDVLFIIDCCYASSMVRSEHAGTKELLAASGRGDKASGSHNNSFTRALTKELKDLKGRPCQVALLHQLLLQNQGARGLRLTPIYACLSREGPTIVLSPLPIADATSLPHVNSYSSGSLTPATSRSVSTSTSRVSSATSLNSIVPTVECRVLITVSLANPSKKPIAAEWINWFRKHAPRDIGGVEVELERFVRPEAAWEYNSTLLLVSLPVALWNALPPNPALSFLAVIRSENLLKDLPNFVAEKVSSEAAHSATPHRRSPLTKYSEAISSLPVRSAEDMRPNPPPDPSDTYSHSDADEESRAAEDLENHHIASGADMPSGPDSAASALSSAQPDLTDQMTAPEDAGRSSRIVQTEKGAQGPSVSPLQRRGSVERSDEWREAVIGQDDALLAELVDSEPPGVALHELEQYILTFNLFRHESEIRMKQEKEDENEGNDGDTADPEWQNKRNASAEQEIEYYWEPVRERVRWLEAYIHLIRDRLGWDVREFDLQLLRSIRRSSLLSPVLGAGVSAAEGCRAPSWPALVQELLEVTLERGLDVDVLRSEDVANLPQQMNEQIGIIPRDSAAAKAVDVDRRSAEGEPADDAGSTDTWTAKFEEKKVKEYSDGDKQRAQQIIDTIKSGKADNNLLMEGAELVYSLCGQALFTLMTGILYRNNRQPSVIHRAIARVAHAQYVPHSQPPALYPGWDVIITYNFDSFMTAALSNEGVPSAAYFMRGNRVMGQPNTLALPLGKVPWTQSVLYLYGYTPDGMFQATDGPFVFAASQYKDTYHQPSSAIFRKVVDHLMDPSHILLYIGCSFIDEYMNRLLRIAFEKWPGRYHYALLRWPKKRDGRVPDEVERKAEEKRYLDIGVRPIWFDEFAEISHIIARLQ